LSEIFLITDTAGHKLGTKFSLTQVCGNYGPNRLLIHIYFTSHHSKCQMVVS
jgi:hypothetical protein